ncbi:uncharacterized protein BCR38DRAFT_450982 [Pseudomassariella vexata]|uniref:Uncharacterized protein n=1 Tax=Pseudomassariella vexata TaxID=1141098 RepID=A0A1Y2DAX4_9PEZI|nr:uncharacterized protein BCR38DRAFT_450982 [Pseudomassariella vexata]ORY56304.1 hypothetical protein BCR38DRAFT_450982 [Pseudomassariella vexata]
MFSPGDLWARSPASTLFSQEEMDAIVSKQNVRAPVAAHAQEPETVIMVARVGVTTVEHGFAPSDERLQAMNDTTSYFPPPCLS